MIPNAKPNPFAKLTNEELIEQLEETFAMFRDVKELLPILVTNFDAMARNDGDSVDLTFAKLYAYVKKNKKRFN